MDVAKWLHELFNERRHCNSMVEDLAQTVSQKTRTTKQDRRERALAYLLENLTGYLDNSWGFDSEEWAVEFVNVIDELRRHMKSPEALVALDRAERRLRHALTSGEGLPRTKCDKCGAVYNCRTVHECYSRKDAARDRAMGHDPDIM